MQSVSRAGANGLETGWTDSTIKGRGEILEELRELTSSPGEIPRLVVLEGPRGTGTSTLAKVLVDQVKHTWRLNAREDPIVIHVNVSSLNHTKGDPSRGVATAILQRFNQGVQVQGSSSGRVVWWALHRIAAQSKPVIVWLDQVHEGTRTVAEVVEPLLEPQRFMERGAKTPPILVVVSGMGKTESGSWAETTPVRWFHVPQLPTAVVEEILVEWAQQSGHVLSPEALAKAMDIIQTRGNQLTVAEEVLRVAIAKAGCHGIITDADVMPPVVREKPRANKRVVELRILEAVRKAGGEIPMGRLHREVARHLVQDGECQPSGSTLRRQTARLEQLGLVERRVVMGGEGGTRSTISLPGHPSLR